MQPLFARRLFRNAVFGFILVLVGRSRVPNCTREQYFVRRSRRKTSGKFGCPTCERWPSRRAMRAALSCTRSVRNKVPKASLALWNQQSALIFRRRQRLVKLAGASQSPSTMEANGCDGHAVCWWVAGLIQQVWFAHAMASQRRIGRPWPTWTAGRPLHQIDVQVRDFECSQIACKCTSCYTKKQLKNSRSGSLQDFPKPAARNS